ncbi:MAG: CDP-diacylglycerol--glycerol-3-phosphate 3-phosphatidyltransferase [Thermotogae bacterium]|nr:MAG: CDP-diacylglycerol--glycerol-3-phosphate 3-phosphatidyltransferase [Thermotogota bacterium]
MPNLVTYSRIVLTVPIVFLLKNECYSIALVIFLIAAFTDYLDGYLARRLNKVSETGKVMDQVADKILVTSVFLALMSEIPLWLIVTVIMRDSWVNGLRILSAKKGIIVPANIWGKVKTVLQFVLILAIMVERTFDLNMRIPVIILVFLTFLATVVSGFIYTYQNRNALEG